jgi:hypothetical protein
LLDKSKNNVVKLYKDKEVPHFITEVIMNNEMTCHYCRKKFTGYYTTVIEDAVRIYFCSEYHEHKYFHGWKHNVPQNEIEQK